MKICPVCTQTFAPTDTRCPTDGVALVVLETHAGLAADLTGQVIDGRYRVEGVIGRGGMGLVYSVRHVVVQKRFAMKVLKPGMERTEDILARFIREAQAANAVRSPHIAESTDFGQLPSGHFYVIMELLEGRSLASALKERVLNRDQLLYVFTQVAETLQQTHAAGIVHRDLKPDNVFLTSDPAQPGPVPLFAKLLDFGVAKVLGTNDASLTQSGVILGTPYYMAPEQARGQQIDHRVDIYSLGVMMYHAFTGRLPFIADSAVAVLTAHALDAPPPPSRVSSVDTGVEQLILRCMEKSPDARFATMTQVAEVLRQLRRVGGPVVMPPAPSGAFPRIDTQSGASFTGPRAAISIQATPIAPKRSWVPWALGGGLMLTLGALAAALIVMRSPGGSPPAQQAQGAQPAASADAPAKPTAEASPSGATTGATPPPSASFASSAATSGGAPSTSPVAAGDPPKGVPVGNVGGVPRPPATPTGAPTAPPTSTFSKEITNPFEHDK